MRIELPSRKVIAAICVTAAIWAYLANVSFPLRRERAAFQQTLAGAEREIAATTEALASLRQTSARAREEGPMFRWAADLANTVPQTYLVETPVTFQTALRDQGLHNAEIHVSQLLPFTPLPDHAIAKWQLRLAHARALPFGRSLAALENAYPLGGLRELSIHRRDASGAADIELEFEVLVRP